LEKPFQKLRRFLREKGFSEEEIRLLLISFDGLIIIGTTFIVGFPLSYLSAYLFPSSLPFELEVTVNFIIILVITMIHEIKRKRKYYF